MAIGKAFPIRKKQVKSYGYAKKNGGPGVSAIAAINGRGAYQGRSARQAMGGLSKNSRVERARALTKSQRGAFARKVRAAKGGSMAPNKTMSRNLSAARSRLRSATRSGVSKPASAGAHTNRRNRMRRNTRTMSAAQRRASLKNLRKARAKHRKNAAKPSRPRRRKKRAAGAVAKRRRRARKASPARRRRTSAAKRRVRRKRKKSSMRANRRRPRRSRRRKSYASNRKARKKTRRRRRRVARSSAPKRRKRRRKAYKANRRRVTRRRRKKRSTKRAAPKRRKRRKAYKANRRTRRSSRRRTRRKSYASNRRRTRRKRKHSANRRRSRKGYRRNKRHARNGRRMFKRNGFVDNMVTAFKIGAVIAAGFAANKLLGKLISTVILDKLLGAPANPATAEPATPPATSGLGDLQPYKGLIGSGLAAVGGTVVTNIAVKDVNTKMLLIGGMWGSFLHGLAVTVLEKVAPAAAGYLAGYDDGTAARLSAMYGLGAGASIMPHYAPISGMGEYFTETAGLGEYFSESMSGLGAYGANPDLYEAAAGYGALPAYNGNHISPNGDLDRELTIAEAAAGVGQMPMQAAAGFGRVQPYEASAGFGVGEYFTEGVQGLGAIKSLPSADTWIPGTSDGQLWAGVRAVNRGQSATEMTPAGILQTDGGSGIFG